MAPSDPGPLLVGDPITVEVTLLAAGHRPAVQAWVYFLTSADHGLNLPGGAFRAAKVTAVNDIVSLCQATPPRQAL